MAKLIKCKTCSNQISSSASVCPHCGQKKSEGLDGCGTVFLILIVIFGFFIMSGNNDKDNNGKSSTSDSSETAQEKKQEPEKVDKEKLDYTKPVFTDSTGKAIVCPVSILNDPKTDYTKLFRLWTTLWNRSGDVKEMGCEEWRGGVEVYQSKKLSSENDMVMFISPYNQSAYFTLEFELTNYPNGKKDASQKDKKSKPDSKQKTNQVKADCSLFDGYKLGMTIDEFKANYDNSYQISDLIEKPDMSLSNGDRTYKISAPIIMNLHQVDADFSFSPNKKLFWISVYIEPSDFNDIKSYLISVFGNPEKSTAPDSYELWPETSSKGRIIMLQAIDNVGLATKEYLRTHGKTKMGNIVLSAGNSCQAN